MGHNYLCHGDVNNAVLAAAGNELPLAQALVASTPGRSLPRTFDQSSLNSAFFTDD
jgi:hypothetical protein